MSYSAEHGLGRKTYLFIVFIFLAQMIHSFYGSFSPSDLTKSYWLISAIFISILLFIPYFINRDSIFNYESRFHRGSSHVVILVLCFSSSATFSLYTAPELFTRLTGTLHETESFVLRKHGSAKGCDYQLKLKDIGYGIVDSMCINASDWNDIHEAENVILTGLQSPLGFYIASVKRKIY